MNGAYGDVSLLDHADLACEHGPYEVVRLNRNVTIYCCIACRWCLTQGDFLTNSHGPRTSRRRRIAERVVGREYNGYRGNCGPADTSTVH